jgi:DNA-binding IclR family transcriptional regulator
VRLNSFVGKRSAAHCTAMGKVLLAQMPESNLDLLYPKEELPGRTSRSVTTKTELLKQLAIIRKHGYAIDDEELEPGLRCVAAPIRDHEDQVIASLTMAGASSRMPVAMIGEYSERVIHYAGLISRALGATDQAA